MEMLDACTQYAGLIISVHASKGTAQLLLGLAQSATWPVQPCLNFHDTDPVHLQRLALPSFTILHANNSPPFQALASGIMSLSAPQQRRGRVSPPPGTGPLSGPSNLPPSARGDAPRLAATPTPSSRLESDADAKLRLRGEGSGVSPTSAAFGGRRGARAGAMLGLRRREWIILGAVCVVACFVRLWNLAHPSSVV